MASPRTTTERYQNKRSERIRPETLRPQNERANRSEANDTTRNWNGRPTNSALETRSARQRQRYQDRRQNNNLNRYPTTSDRFTDERYEQTYDPYTRRQRARERRAHAKERQRAQNATTEIAYNYASPSRYRNTVRAGKQNRSTSRNTIKSAVRSAGAFRFTVVFIWSWYVTLWASTQLWFALLSVIAIGSAAAVESSTVANFTLDVLELSVSTFTGNEFVLFGSMFAFFWFLTIAIGWLSLAAAYVAYSTRGYKPLSGTHSGSKFLLFLVAFVGTAMPLLNLFPWLILWTLSVARYPK